MGDKVVQDYALSRGILIELLNHLEDDYDNAQEKDAIIEFAVLLLIGVFAWSARQRNYEDGYIGTAKIF